MGPESAHTATALDKEMAGKPKAVNGPDRPNCSWTGPVLCGQDRRIAEQSSVDLSLSCNSVVEMEGKTGRSVSSLLMNHVSNSNLLPNGEFQALRSCRMALSLLHIHILYPLPAFASATSTPTAASCAVTSKESINYHQEQSTRKPASPPGSKSSGLHGVVGGGAHFNNATSTKHQNKRLESRQTLRCLTCL
ncbi:Plastocyanin-like domain [Musa troglodytarum]|uniref:Plastocyanin-like domain n=1 Tax=Musa troglodytarum TaxID=320322 RepID=A0A9E7HH27_9LILI|nr:Plastocyanin-like domain [Musa troglodytarum]